MNQRDDFGYPSADEFVAALRALGIGNAVHAGAPVFASGALVPIAAMLSSHLSNEGIGSAQSLGAGLGAVVGLTSIAAVVLAVVRSYRVVRRALPHPKFSTAQRRLLFFPLGTPLFLLGLAVGSIIVTQVTLGSG